MRTAHGSCPATLDRPSGALTPAGHRAGLPRPVNAFGAGSDRVFTNAQKGSRNFGYVRTLNLV